MKKTFLLIAMLALNNYVFSQDKPVHHSELAKHPSLMTPELGLAISQFGIGEDGYLPPPISLTYNLADSSYYYFYEEAMQDWDLNNKTYYENDCAVGLPIVSTLNSDNLVPNLFEPAQRSTWAYFPNGNIKLSTLSTVYNNNWVLLSYDSLVAPNKSLERWNKSYNSNTDLFTYGTRIVGSYDSEERLLVSQYFTLDIPTQNWVPDNRYTNTYSNGLLTNFLYERYNFGLWEPMTKTDYTYFPGGQLMEAKSYINLGGTWFQDQRYSYTIDGVGNSVLELLETFNSGTGQFEPSIRTATTYDAANELTGRLTEVYLNGAWENSTKSEYTHYADGKLKDQIDYEWDATTEAWIETFKSHYSASGKILSSEYRGDYDPVNQVFNFGYRFNFTYNADDLILEQKFDNLQGGTFDTYIPYNLINYEYDNEGGLLEKVEQLWDLNSSTMKLSNKTHYFNTGCSFSDTDGPLEAKSNCQYANPIQPGQPIQCTGLSDGGSAMLELYDLAGRLVHQQAFAQTSSLDLRHPLPAGLYLLSIHDDKGWSYRSKVVVEQ